MSKKFSTVGLYTYSFRIKESRKDSFLEFKSDIFQQNVHGIVSRFINEFSTVPEDEEMPRQWSFEPHNQDDIAVFHGIIRYGESGYQSRIIDRKSLQPRYDRRVQDLELIPLYYYFFIPRNDAKVGILAFQSFKGRSCIGLIQSQLRRYFSLVNDNITLIFERVFPYSEEQVREGRVSEVVFYKNSDSLNIEDRYRNKVQFEPGRIELRIKANSKFNLPRFGILQQRAISNKETFLKMNDSIFDGANAKVEVGGRTLSVTLAGINKDIGLIDLTDKLDFKDGHPTIDSIEPETKNIVSSIFRRISL